MSEANPHYAQRGWYDVVHQTRKDRQAASVVIHAKKKLLAASLAKLNAAHERATKP